MGTGSFGKKSRLKLMETEVRGLEVVEQVVGGFVDSCRCGGKSCIGRKHQAQQEINRVKADWP